MPREKKGRANVLGDHTRVGKKFYPTLALYENLGPGIEWVRWSLPELLWIALVIDRCGPRNAANMLWRVIAWRKASLDTVTLFASDFGTLSEADRSTFLAAIEPEIAKALADSLATFTKLFPQFPMAWLVPVDELEKANGDPEQLNKLEALIRRYEDRRSEEGMKLQVIAWVGVMNAGCIKVPSASALPDPNRMLTDPHSDKSKMDASRVRAYLNLFLSRTNGSAWTQEFWRQGRAMTPCRVLVPKTRGPFGDRKMNPESWQTMMNAGRRFIDDVEKELAKLSSSFLNETEIPARGEVLLGLLRRQATIASDVLCNPFYTLPPWAEFAERAMSETLIRMKWLVKQDRKEDYEWFVDYGRGQVKLRIEQLKSLAEQDSEARDSALQEAEMLTKWLASQQYDWLQVVDVGGGTHDKDLRKLATEAGCKDEHSLRFQWLSGFVHGHWHALNRDNLTHCVNPLHGLHRLPYAKERYFSFGVTLDLLELYVSCYLEVCKLAGVEVEASDAAQAWITEAQERNFWDLVVPPEAADDE